MLGQVFDKCLFADLHLAIFSILSFIKTQVKNMADFVNKNKALFYPFPHHFFISNVTRRFFNDCEISFEKNELHGICE